MRVWGHGTREDGHSSGDSEEGSEGEIRAVAGRNRSRATVGLLHDLG